MDADVLIVGAGPAGLTLAQVLARGGLSVTLLERQPRAALARPAFDGREIALTHASRQLLEHWRLWQRLPEADISPLRRARVFDDAAPGRHLDIPPASSTERPLGWLVPNQRLREAAFHGMATSDGVTLLDQVQVRQVHSDRASVQVELEDGRQLRGRLLVAADSRFSGTRRAFGIPASMHDYGKSMLVCRMRHPRPHGQEAWEWFGQGQTRALLPLNGHQSSVVVTLPHAEMDALLTLDDDAFDRDITARYQGRLGPMTRVSERHVYPLVGVYANRFHGRRMALVGDAAVGMHPVTAHGFNLGLTSVAHLSDRVLAATRQGRDPGDPALLGAYTWAHRRSSLPVFTATSLVVALHTDDRLPARLLRRTALTAASMARPLQRLLAWQVTRAAPMARPR